MNPIVSIIVPVYKAEKYLSRCVDSVLNQTLKEIELILVDDGSPDNCPALCDAYSQKDARVKVLHQNNSGVSVARNSGIQIATGKYISFVDSDDWIELNTYERVVNVAEQKRADIVQWNFDFTGSGSSFFEIEKIKKNSWLLLDGVALPTLKNSCCNQLFLRKLLTQNGICFPEGILVGEDRHFSYCAMACSENIYQISDVLYHYWENMESATNTDYSIKKIEDDVKSILLTERFMKDKGITKLDASIKRTKIRIKNLCYGKLTPIDFKMWRKIFPELNIKSIFVKEKTSVINFLLMLHLDYIARLLVNLKRVGR